MKLQEIEYWEFGVLQIHNPKVSTYGPYFDLIPKSEGIKGDLVEIGVWRGASLLTSGLLLQGLSSTKKVHGYDTFSGFPSKSTEDEFSNFEEMYKAGQISKSHIERVRRNLRHLSAVGKSSLTTEISSSLDFSSTSLELVKKKVNYLNLDVCIELHDIDVIEMNEHDLPESISLVLLDVDLYKGYKSCLPLIWDRLTPGGSIYLDEYFSLKFPGPRLAVDDFCKKMNIEPRFLCNWLDFERWVITKPVRE